MEVVYVRTGYALVCGDRLELGSSLAGDDDPATAALGVVSPAEPFRSEI